MRERQLDEFESLFQRSVIPTIEVEKIDVKDVVVLADFSERAVACGEVGRELKERFGATVSVRFLLHPSDHRHADKAQAIMEQVAGDERRLVEGDLAAHLGQIVDEEKPSLIVAPAPLHLCDESAEAETLGRFIDSLLISTSIPTLLMRSVPEGSVFQTILAKIPGGRHELIEQFSFAFALCRPGGAIHLLHVVEEERLKEISEALEVAPGIDSKAGAEELRSAIETRMDHLLRGAVRTAEDASFDVDAAVRMGDPFDIVPEEAKDCTLLIVGSATSHTEFLESRAYEIIRRIPGLPVLAL